MRRGDEAAFAELYRRWQGPLYRYALRMSGQMTLAEDVVIPAGEIGNERAIEVVTERWYSLSCKPWS